VGREYLRVSYDRSGRERSQDEQQQDNAHACGERGIGLREPYREAGSASASRYARRSRDDFDRLLADLSSGRFDADVLVLWESSRGSRRVGEWVTLIELCEQQQVSIFVTTHGREYAPVNARDRRSLLEDAVDSEYESSKTSARAVRTHAASAEAGRPVGRPVRGGRSVRSICGTWQLRRCMPGCGCTAASPGPGRGGAAASSAIRPWPRRQRPGRRW
jgi:DNA invertase Pin-like site-specific DNA recombinase